MLFNSIEDKDEKFIEWLNSSNKIECSDWYQLSQKCPKFSKAIEHHEFNRYKIYEIFEYFEELEVAFNYNENSAKYYPNLDVEKWKELGFELMEANIGSFKYDW